MSAQDANITKVSVAASPCRWRLAAFFVAWTLLAALAVWWLLGHQMSTPSAVMTPDSGSAKLWTERMREWLTLAHVNFHSAYPWILLAPYVIWLGARFPIEKRGWLWRAPLLLAVGFGFVIAAQEFTRRLTPRLPAVVVISMTSKIRNLRVEGASVSSEQRLPGDPALRELPQVLSNLASAHPPYGIVSVQSLARPTGGSNAPPAALPPGAVPPEIASLIASNLLPSLGTRLASLSQGGPPTDRGSGGLDGLAYFALIGLAHAGVFYRRYREREQQAALLENRLNQARLRTLQAQLQPHFLFNALNGIATLVRRDPPAAEEMLTSLSELLRLALSQSGRQEIPLRDEIEFLNRYLEIQQMRFRDRLGVEQAIEPSALDCAVPALLLQPLVENAIHHGIEPSPEFGLVRISATRDGSRLVLAIEDNGVGLGQGNGESNSGLGLANVRERLTALYPGQHEFQMGPRPGGGVAVRVSIPWRVAVENAGSGNQEPAA